VGLGYHTCIMPTWLLPASPDVFWREGVREPRGSGLCQARLMPKLVS
jgi:hypothetical protein